MKKTDFRVMDNRDVVAQFDGKAIAFIKSRKADHKIHAMATEMIEMALDLDVELTDVIVDGSANDDIDRRVITEFCQTLDGTEAVMVFVNNIFSFTTDPDDLFKFIDTLMNKPVLIVDMEHHLTLSPEVPNDSESNDE